MIKIENIVDLTLEELTEKNSLLGFKNYISNQIFDWIHNKRVFSFNDMSNISKDNRELLNRKYQIGTLKEVECQNSSNKTIKFLFELNDGNKIETVLMKQNYGWSVCVTTQVGCNMGCGFCASIITNGKLYRLNLKSFL